MIRRNLGKDEADLLDADENVLMSTTRHATKPAVVDIVARVRRDAPDAVVEDQSSQ